MTKHPTVHLLGAMITAILLSLGLAIGSAIAMFAGPIGFIAAVPMGAMGVAFWVLSWMVSSGTTDRFQFLRDCLVDASYHHEDTGQSSASLQPPLRPFTHLLALIMTLTLMVAGLAFGGVGIALWGPAFGLPSAVIMVLIGLLFWVMAWMFVEQFDLLSIERSTHSQIGSQAQLGDESR